MVSSHANNEVYATFLKHVTEAITRHARRLASHQVAPSSCLLPGQHDRFASNCAAAAKDEWSPLFVMIDGDDAERLAIERVFPGVCIRVCQFHLIQACRSFCRRLYGTTNEGVRTTKIMLDAIRQAQRCPQAELWEQFYGEFGRTAQGVSTPQQWQALDTYIQDEWFSPRWLSKAVDFGLPVHLTRDAGLSTNNYAEAAFRVFDRVFLLSRCNKR